MTQYVVDTIHLMAQNWFLSEPAFYAVYCTQQLEENARIACGVRCGKGRLEYNPLVLEKKSYREIELLFRTEVIRLLLKHPYERRPEGCTDRVIAIGSDITLGDNYCFIHSKEKLPVQTPEAYHLPLGMHYEWYVHELQNQQDSDSPQQDNRNTPPNDSPEEGKDDMSDKSRLWEEDELGRERINQLIERTTEWGSMPAELVERIQVAARPAWSHRHVIQAFRAAVMAESTTLTRMRPNRRTGYLQMGRRRQFVSHLLMAIDVSGSVSQEMIAHFFAVVNQLFSYGIAKMDVLTFDAGITSVMPYQKKQTEIVVTGRGGTLYQPVLDYAQQHAYSGVVIFTDGEGELPTSHQSASLPSALVRPDYHTPILWALSSNMQFTKHASHLEPLGRVCVI